MTLNTILSVVGQNFPSCLLSNICVLSGHSLLDQTHVFKWYMRNLCNVDVLDSIAYLNKILVFERYVGARCGSKSGHQRVMWSYKRLDCMLKI